MAIQSDATNLVPGDTGLGIYVRDRKLGTTERIDVAPGGVQADEPSFDPALSADGRFVAFATYATNLVPGDTNDHRDVFVRDRKRGTTELVSVRSDGTQATNDSEAPSLSADGRFVAFVRVNCRDASFTPSARATFASATARQARPRR